MTAVLVLRGPASALPETLDSLARQTRSPERLVVVDPGVDGNAVETVRAHRGVADAIPSITIVTVPRRGLPRVCRAVGPRAGRHRW